LIVEECSWLSHKTGEKEWKDFIVSIGMRNRLKSVKLDIIFWF